MKIAALIGVNVLVVGAGILAYDVVRSGDDGQTAELTEQIEGLNERLDDIESRFGALDRGASERKLSSRLLQLEGRIGSLEAGRSLASAELADSADDVDGAAAAVATAMAAEQPAQEGDALAAQDIERVKKALAEVERQRDTERATRMATGLADRLGLALTDEQRDKLGAALHGFRETARDKMRETRAAGGGREEMMLAFDDMRAELTTELEGFLSVSDAKAVTDELGNGGRMMMGGGPGRGGGGFGR